MYYQLTMGRAILLGMKWLTIFLISVLPVLSLSAQEIVSQWDDPAAELAGWEKGTMNTFIVYRSNGGNPGGFIEAYGNLKTGIINKQPEFTGDYIQRDFNNISVDIMVIMQQLPNFKPALTIRYSSSFAGWNYELSDFTVDAGIWQHFEVYFNPTWTDAEAQAGGWYLSPGPAKSFRETLEHVRSIAIAGGYPQISSKNLGYDNFKLSHAEPPLPTAPPQEEQQGDQDGAASQDSQDQETGSKQVPVKQIKIKPRIFTPNRDLRKYDK